MSSPTTEQVREYAAKLAQQAMPDYPHDEKALHCYRKPDGSLLYWRVRVKTHAEIPTDIKRKEIRPFWFNGKSLVTGEPPAPPEGKPLYALELLAMYPAAKVIVCEGENKADAINKCAMQGRYVDAIIATTSGGASSALASNWQPLAGRVVIVWPDNDDAGLKYAADVVVRLRGSAATVSILDIAAMNLPHKGDAVDYFKAGGTIEGLLQAIETANALGSDFSRLNDAGDASTPPEPLPTLPDVLPFDYAYLPDGLRGFVKDISERMQCPPDFAAVGVLVMMATIIGRKISIRPKQKDNWTVIPNLWGAVVGNSGVKKSPTLSAALSPLNKLATAAHEIYSTEKAAYDEIAEFAKLQQSVNKSAARATLKKDQSADVKNLLQSSDTDDAPILKRYTTNNATYEALGELLMENPNGLLVESDEIIGLLKQLDASGQETARSFYLTAADGDKSYTFDRIMRGKGQRIEALCLSIIGGIQPGVLAEYVRQATGGGAGAGGLLQRFGLMVYPDITPDTKYVDRYPDNELRQSVNQLAETLDNLKPFQIGAETDQFGGIPFLHFDSEAQDVFAEWIVELDTRLRSGEEHPAIVSHLSKYRKLIPSLALINHLCDNRQGAVNKSALLRAIAFSEYLETHAKRIYSYATRPDIDAAKTLLKRLATGKLSNPFKARDIYRAGWAGLETPNKAQSAIDLLIDYHHLRSEEVITGGRPATHYHCVKVGAA